MNISRAAIFSGPLLVALVSASPALAANPADQAAAEVLFTDARKLAKAGDFAHACPKFAESQRLDPTAGGGLSAGDCFEKLGKLASAWGAFKEAEIIARDAGDTGRQGEAERRAGALSAKLAKLVIVVPAGARAPGFEVRRDGAVVGEGQWGSAVPVDAGQHRIEASAPGRKLWSTVVGIETDGASTSVNVPPLAPLGQAPVLAPAASSADGGAAPMHFWGAQRVAGVALGGGGLVGVIVGAGFAAKAASKNSDSLANCRSSDETKCNAIGVAQRNDAFDAARVSTVTFIGGGIMAATGLIVFLAAPSTRSKRDASALRALPMAGPGVAGLAFQGAWQ